MTMTMMMVLWCSRNRKSRATPASVEIEPAQKPPQIQHPGFSFVSPVYDEIFENDYIHPEDDPYQRTNFRASTSASEPYERLDKATMRLDENSEIWLQTGNHRSPNIPACNRYHR